LKTNVHFRPVLFFRWRDFPDSSYLIFQTLTVENLSFIDVVYVNCQGHLYLHYVGKGMVRPYLIRRADSGNLYRHTAWKWEEWVWLGSNQIHCNCEERRK